MYVYLPSPGDLIMYVCLNEIIKNHIYIKDLMNIINIMFITMVVISMHKCIWSL